MILHCLWSYQTEVRLYNLKWRFTQSQCISFEQMQAVWILNGWLAYPVPEFRTVLALPTCCSWLRFFFFFFFYWVLSLFFFYLLSWRVQQEDWDFYGCHGRRRDYIPESATVSLDCGFSLQVSNLSLSGISVMGGVNLSCRCHLIGCVAARLSLLCLLSVFRVHSHHISIFFNCTPKHIYSTL